MYIDIKKEKDQVLANLENIEENLKGLADNKRCIPSIAFADYHCSKSLGFETHPKHALAKKIRSRRLF